MIVYLAKASRMLTLHQKWKSHLWEFGRVRTSSVQVFTQLSSYISSAFTETGRGGILKVLTSMQAAFRLYYLLEIRIPFFLITWQTNHFFPWSPSEIPWVCFKYYMNNSFYSLHVTALNKSAARIPSSGKLIWSIVMTLISQCLGGVWPT